jgi:hypothetical protein
MFKKMNEKRRRERREDNSYVDTMFDSVENEEQKAVKDTSKSFVGNVVGNVVSQVAEEENSKRREQESGAEEIADQYYQKTKGYGLDDLFQEAEVSNANEVFGEEEEEETKEDIKPPKKKKDKKEGSHQTRDGILYENITVPRNIFTKFKLATSSYKEYALKFMKTKNKREKLGLSLDNTMLMSESFYLSGNPSTSGDNKIVDLIFDEPDAFMEAMTLPKDQNKPTLKTPNPTQPKTPVLTQKERPDGAGAGAKSDSSSENDSSPPTEIPKTVSVLVSDSSQKNWNNNKYIGQIKIGKKLYGITKISKGREKNEFIVKGNFSRGDSQTIRKFTYQPDGTFKKGDQVALKDVGMAVRVKRPTTKTK